MIQRWTLTDVDTNETIRLPRNPRAMGNLQAAQRTQTSGRLPEGVVRVVSTPVSAFPWQFEGTLRSRAEYDLLASWVGRRRVIVTDHLGREHVVIPMAFEPKPKGQSGVGNEWLYDYTFKTVYVGEGA